MTKIGALWKKTSRDKEINFMSGEITIDDKITKIVVFPNRFKKEDEQPDYTILESKPLDKDKPKEEMKVKEEKMKQ